LTDNAEAAVEVISSTAWNHVSCQRFAPLASRRIKHTPEWKSASVTQAFIQHFC